MASGSRIASLGRTLALAGRGLRAWTGRQVLAAVLASLAFGLLVGVATVLIPNPVFGREIEPVPWNYPVWILASVLTGMVVATFVRPVSPRRAHGPAPDGTDADDQVGASPPVDPAQRRGSRFGVAGGVLAWFAVGCPVCNKLVLLAVGYSGALTWFAPVQPFLGLGAIALSAIALIWRLRGQVACAVPTQPPAGVARG